MLFFVWRVKTPSGQQRFVYGSPQSAEWLQKNTNARRYMRRTRIDLGVKDLAETFCAIPANTNAEGVVDLMSVGRIRTEVGNSPRDG